MEKVLSWVALGKFSISAFPSVQGTKFCPQSCHWPQLSVPSGVPSGAKAQHSSTSTRYCSDLRFSIKTGTPE